MRYSELQLPDVSEKGAVILNRDVVCDGLAGGFSARVQTHIHTDHMDGFHASKGFQDILVSPGTWELLAAELNADVPYRRNIICVPPGGRWRGDRFEVELVPSGHMLGAMQVAVEGVKGERVGYSGDFAWPIESVVEVDTVVVDSTYGTPQQVRNFSQGYAEECFASLLGGLLKHGPVHIVSHRGTLQRGLQVASEVVDGPLLVSQSLAREASIYEKRGYIFGNLVVPDDPLGKNILKHESSYVRFYGRGDGRPVDVGGGSQIKLSAYFTRPDHPVVEYSPRAYGVALSNHADFYGTLEYVQATGASRVVTDNSRGGNGLQLAFEIQRRLNVSARASSNVVLEKGRRGAGGHAVDIW